MLAEETEEFFDAIETLAAQRGRPAAPAHRGRHGVGRPLGGGRGHRGARGAARCPRSAPPRQSLRALLPPFAAVGNPVDLTPQVEPASIAPAVRRVFDEPGHREAWWPCNVGLDFPEFADGVVTAARETGKPAVAFTADAPEITAALPRAAACRCCRAPSAPSARGARSGARARRAPPVHRPPAGAVARGAARPRPARGARCPTRWPGACWRRAACGSAARRSWPTRRRRSARPIGSVTRWW